MENVSKELLRNYIKEQKFTNADDILIALKGMFRDILKETLEAEMDESLGYFKYDSAQKTGLNSRNGYSKKTIKTELGPVDVNIPRDRTGDFELKIIPKHQRSWIVNSSIKRRSADSTVDFSSFSNDGGV